MSDWFIGIVGVSVHLISPCYVVQQPAMTFKHFACDLEVFILSCEGVDCLGVSLVFFFNSLLFLLIEFHLIFKLTTILILAAPLLLL